MEEITRFMTIEELAQILHYSTKTIYKKAAVLDKLQTLLDSSQSRFECANKFGGFSSIK